MFVCKILEEVRKFFKLIFSITERGIVYTEV